MTERILTVRVTGQDGEQEAVNAWCLAAAKDVAAQARAAGVTLFSAPVKVPAGVVKFAAGEKTLLYFLDPDGVILELAEYG